MIVHDLGMTNQAPCEICNN